MEANSQRIILRNIARKAMDEKGFQTGFPPGVLKELEIVGLNSINQQSMKDLRHLLWCSIDNEDSRDLDQLSWAEKLTENSIRVLIAIADVDALVEARSEIDIHASLNTTSVYTVAELFPMLPELLSTNLTSLNENEDRAALVIEMVVEDSGIILSSDVYCAMVHNYAKLDYETVGNWLDGTVAMPELLRKIEGLAENIRLQEKAAQDLRELRYERGALDFEKIEARPVFEGDILTAMKETGKNRAKNMIEDFMIASNTVTAQFLASKGFPSLRRVVKTPGRWDRMVELAREQGFNLTGEASPKSLAECFKFVKNNHPGSYTDFTFSILKLIGGGEYILEMPGMEPVGHFGLAVKDYAHSTAPNRRYPDLITHRLLKAAMNGGKSPYSEEELRIIADNCTKKEDDAKKIERLVEKSANAMLMQNRSGEVFDGIISGAAPKGTWIRIDHPWVEGKLVKGFEGLLVGQKVKARLLSVDIESGFIDFERAE